METLIDLQNRIYQQNKLMGWHDEPRSFNTFICLFHSELSEATEGLRKQLMDDHLSSYPMAAVEIADFVIRVLDWFGTQQDLDIEQLLTLSYPDWDNLDFIAQIHQNVSAAQYFHTIDFDSTEQIKEHLSQAVSIANSMAENNKWDLLTIINEKLKYNQNRADHKRENRAKDGGKKF